MSELKTRIVSIHDVMPTTLNEVVDCISACESRQIGPVYLLVVPGLNWRHEQLTVLRELSSRGHQLVAHGWVHKVDEIKGIKHWLHSQLISRNVAEHLAQDDAGILQLMQRSRSWFQSVKLPSPDIYVPPAWALGNVSLEQLKQTGFRYVECQMGIYDTHRSMMQPLPLLGYEVDNRWRECAVRLWNSLNRYREKSEKPARLSIHPMDFTLRLRRELCQDLDTTRGIEVSQAFLSQS